MRKTVPVAATLGLAALLAAALAARADDQPETVSDYVNVLNGSASRLDQQVNDRQKAGDMAAAQRLVLVAAMLRATSAEFRIAEQEQLTDKMRKLPAPIPDLVRAAVAKGAEAEQTAADKPAFVDDAQKTFNALLQALPVTTPHPVLYGLLSRDLAGPESGLPSDVVVYGYRIVDPYMKVAPTIFYGKSEFSAADVAVKDDKILVTLPADIKTAVRFAPPPCDARPSFGLRVRETYERRRGVWPISWNTEVVNNADFYALPSPVIYAAKITASFESKAASVPATLTFRKRSDLTIVDCDESKAVEVAKSLPEDAKDVTCAATWIDSTGAVKITSQCQIEGATAHGSGSLTAGGKVCSPEKSEKICTCTTPAEGWLEISGSYKVLQPSNEVKAAAETLEASFPAGGVAKTDLNLGQDQMLRHVFVDVSRRACEKSLDTIDVAVGDDQNASYKGISKTGAFRATLKQGALTFGTMEAYPITADEP